MKKYLLFAVLLLSACGDPSLSGIPSATVEPDPVYPLYTVIRLFSDAAGVTLSNVPVGGTELTNNVSRAYLDLTDYSEVRGHFTSHMAVSTVGCRIDYSLNDGGNWDTLIPSFAATAIALSASKSGWVEIPEAARTEVLVRVVITGEGTVDPVIRYAGLEIRGETVGE